VCVCERAFVCMFACACMCRFVFACVCVLIRVYGRELIFSRGSGHGIISMFVTLHEV